DLDKELLLDSSGKPIALRRQCFAVLCHLIGHAHQLVTKDELIAEVWPDFAVTDDSLVQCIHEIRRALGDDGHAVLKTVPKRGYRLVLPPDARPEDSGSAGSARFTIRRPSRVAGIVLGIVALLLVAQVSWRIAAVPWMDDAQN